MRKLIEIKNLNNEIFVYWTLTDFCNQHCTYCPSALNLGAYANSPSFPNDSEIDLFLDKLITIQQQTQKRLVVNISGGEPTLHNKFSNIIERLHDSATIIVTTNGARSVGWWQTLPKQPHLVILSLHPEYYNSKKLKINQLCEFLKDGGVDIQFNLMCHPDMWDTVMEIVNDVDDRFKPFIIPKVILDQDTFTKDMYSYTSDQLDFIKNYPTKLDSSISWDIRAVYSNGDISRVVPNTIMAEGLHYFHNWRCTAGSESIYVSANGEVSAGICNAQLLGNISNFNLLNESLICPRARCVHPGDISLSKYNPITISK
jgi:sulfatase maturation enzyme AslB (radical SAM superfamily)